MLFPAGAPPEEDEDELTVNPGMVGGVPPFVSGAPGAFDEGVPPVHGPQPKTEFWFAVGEPGAGMLISGAGGGAGGDAAATGGSSGGCCAGGVGLFSTTGITGAPAELGNEPSLVCAGAAGCAGVAGGAACGAEATG